MKILTNIISMVFHPIYMIIYMVLITNAIDPHLFSSIDPQNLSILWIYLLSITVLIPIISILVMKNLGFLESFQMKTREERYGPLIITGVCYLWLFVNFKNNDIFPPILISMILGAAISLFIGFFITIFSKISMHTIGISGLLMATILFAHFRGNGFIDFSINQNIYQIHLSLLISILIIVAGIVGFARIHLKAHKISEISGGFLVGILGQIVASYYIIN